MKTEKESVKSPSFWVPSLYLAQGLPFFAVMVLAGQMLKSMGLANNTIARWTALLGAAWILKPLWSPFLELVSSKKKVVVFFELAGGVCLLLVALALQLPFWFTAVICMLALIAVCAATHDIACDGLYIVSLSEKRQAEYAGWTGTFFNAGRVIAAGGLLTLAGYLEKSSGVIAAWSTVFIILGGAMLVLGFYNMKVLPQARNPVSTQSASEIANMLEDVIIEYFRKPGIWVAIAFIILFRAGEAQVHTIGPLFLREARALGGLGLDTIQVGEVYGGYGTVAFIIGSVAGGYFTAWLGLKRAILALILAVNLPNIAFWYLASTQPTDLAVIGVAIGIEMFGYGFGFVGLILFMMQVVAPGRYQTAHYALSTGIMQLGYALFKYVSGDIQMTMGYQNFFLWVILCSVPVLIMSQVVSMSPMEKNVVPA